MGTARKAPVITAELVENAKEAINRTLEWQASMAARFPPPPVPKPLSSLPQQLVAVDNFMLGEGVCMPFDALGKWSKHALCILGHGRSNRCSAAFEVCTGSILKVRDGGFVLVSHFTNISRDVWRAVTHRIINAQDTLIAAETTPASASSLGRVEVFIIARPESQPFSNLEKTTVDEVRKAFGGIPIIRFSYNAEKGDFLDYRMQWSTVHDTLEHGRPSLGGAASGSRASSGAAVARDARGKPMTFVDVCAGGGGLSVGLAQAGLVPLAGVEVDRCAAETYHRNMNSLFANSMDLSRVDAYHMQMSDFRRLLHDPFGNMNLLPEFSRQSKLQSVWELLGGKAAMLCGGIPCQAYSSANAKKRMNPADKRRRAWQDFASLMQLLPGLRYALVEEVPEFLEAEGSNLVRCALELGFQAKVRLLNAGNVGVAQNRLRAFLVYARLGENMPDDPPPTHRFDFEHASKPNALGAWHGMDIVLRPPRNSGAPMATLQDAIGHLLDCDVTPGRWSQQRRDPPHQHYVKALGPLDMQRRQVLTQGEGDNKFFGDLAHLQPTDSGKRSAKKLHWFDSPQKYGVARLDRPSATITTCCEPGIGPYFHPTQNRCFTVRERLCIQGFPSDFQTLSGQMKGSDAEHIDKENEIVGNAVPPPLARAWGAMIAAAAQKPKAGAGYGLSTW